MIDQTIPLPQLTAGFARCLREWILPHLTDPMARTQAETLAVLIEALPGSLGPEAQRAIAADSDAARRMLLALGQPADQANVAGIDAALRDNSALKALLQSIADDARGDVSDAGRQRLRDLQGFFLESMQREIDMTKRGADFAAMSAREDTARKS